LRILGQELAQPIIYNITGEENDNGLNLGGICSVGSIKGDWVSDMIISSNV
jgi:hypothetical protein